MIFDDNNSVYICGRLNENTNERIFGLKKIEYNFLDINKDDFIVDAACGFNMTIIKTYNHEIYYVDP